MKKESVKTATCLIIFICLLITIFFVERVKIYFQETGYKMLSVKHTLSHSGRAITFNSVVVILGFLVLLFSVFPPKRLLGALVSLNMLTSFVATVTMMHPLFYTSNIFLKKDSESENHFIRNHKILF